MTTRLEFEAMLRDTQRMPRLGERSKLSAEALRILFNGQELSVQSLKVRVADLTEHEVVLEFAFCNAEDQTIVNIGRHTMHREDVLRIVNITDALHFSVD